jgi:AAA ATPase containing von Willebrand factor type A (vWA) domain
MYVPVDGGFDWMPGPIDICYSKGGLLVIDEIIEASGPVKTFLYGAMDRGPGGTISYAGRVFEQSEGYQVVATMNGWPDQGGLPPALLDRFDAWFIVTQPSEEQLALLEPDLREMCRLSYDPEVVEDEMAGPDVTFRMLLGLQKLRKIMPIEMAVLAACRGNKVLAQSFYDVLQITDDEEEEAIPQVPAKTTVMTSTGTVRASRRQPATTREIIEDLHRSHDTADDWEDE